MSGCMALCRALQWNAGGRRAQGCEGQGGRARMDRDTERMKETRRKKVRQLRKKKGGRLLFMIFIITKAARAARQGLCGRAALCQCWMRCRTNNDGTDSHNRNGAVVFKVAAENEGARPLLPHFPTHPPSVAAAHPNSGWSGVFLRRFEGTLAAAEGKGRRGWELGGRRGHQSSGSSSLCKPVHSKDGPFNLHWAASVPHAVWCPLWFAWAFTND